MNVDIPIVVDWYWFIVELHSDSWNGGEQLRGLWSLTTAEWVCPQQSGPNGRSPDPCSGQFMAIWWPIHVVCIINTYISIHMYLHIYAHRLYMQRICNLDEPSGGNGRNQRDGTPLVSWGAIDSRYYETSCYGYGGCSGSYTRNVVAEHDTWCPTGTSPLLESANTLAAPGRKMLELWEFRGSND